MNEKKRIPEEIKAEAVEKKSYQAPAWEVEEAETEAAMTCNKADDFCAPGPIQS